MKQTVWQNGAIAWKNQQQKLDWITITEWIIVGIYNRKWQMKIQIKQMSPLRFAQINFIFDPVK